MATKEWREKNQDKLREYRRSYYYKNRDSEKARIYKRKQDMKKWVKDLKIGLKCERCGQDHPATLDFHHKNADEKEVMLSMVAQEKGWGKERILLEVEKCEVLCSNCHRILHWEEKNKDL